jgi:hypothetical protein
MRNWALCLAVISAGTAWAQGLGTTATASQPVRPIGVVTQLQPGKLTLHTDAGSDLLVLLPDGVSALRVPPGAKDLSAASKISITDLSAGDRILVRGRVSDDQKSVLAAVVIVMTRTDLASAREAERQEWQRRGIEGPVTAVNAEKREITISVPTTPRNPGNPTHPVTIALAASATLLRYAPDSVKFSDAKPATFEEIKVGDQVRALTTKTEDSSRLIAEKLVFGTFRTLGATVVSVDAQNGTVTVNDLISGRSVLVRTNADSKLHRLPPSLAKMLAAFNSGASNGPPTSSSKAGPADGSRDFQQMLESAPALTLGELKPTDALIVLSMEGANPSEVTAIIVLAGVEPILAAQPKGSTQTVLGPWRMGMGGGEGGP